MVLIKEMLSILYLDDNENCEYFGGIYYYEVDFKPNSTP